MILLIGYILGISAYCRKFILLSKQESFLATGDRFNLAVSTGHAIFKQIIMVLVSLIPQFVIWPEEDSYETLSTVSLLNKIRFCI